MSSRPCAKRPAKGVEEEAAEEEASVADVPVPDVHVPARAPAVDGRARGKGEGTKDESSLTPRLWPLTPYN